MEKNHKKIRFCRVKDCYVTHLKKHCNKVTDNYNERRPYLGIVLEINNKKYIAPLSSNKNGKKDRLKKIKNDTIFKIDEGNLGFVHLNNMIPIVNDAIIDFNFDNEPNKKYQILLKNQFQFCDNNKTKLFKKAERLYSQQQKGVPFVVNLCCNFSILEEKCIEYKQNKKTS